MDCSQSKIEIRVGGFISAWVASEGSFRTAWDHGWVGFKSAWVASNQRGCFSPAWAVCGRGAWVAIGGHRWSWLAVGRVQITMGRCGLKKMSRIGISL